MNASVWNPNPKQVPQANVNGTVKEEPQLAIAGQRSFTLDTFAFVPNTNSIEVFKNGKILARNIDYFEVNSTQLILNDECVEGDVVLFKGFVGITGTSADDPVLRADLKKTTGATQVFEGNDSVSAILQALQLTDYAALRNYGGDRKSVVVTGYFVASSPSGIAGQFIRDDVDKASADNGGTTIIDKLGRRWKRVYAGEAHAKWFGVIGDGVTDDSNAVEAAMNSGVTKLQFSGLNIKLTRRICAYTTNVRYDLTGALVTQVTPNTDAFTIGYNGVGFKKTDYVTFIGGRIVGADNGLTATTSTGIGMYPPPDNPYVSGAGCSHIKVFDAYIEKFCSGIAGTGANDIEVDGNTLFDMKYHQEVSAGGYGMLFQTCFNINIGSRNDVIYGTTTRHGVYISADPSRVKDASNVCNEVYIGAMLVDGTACIGTTGFEAGIYIRSASNVKVDGPRIRKTFGGLVYDTQNAPSKNITLLGIQATGVRATANGENAGVGFTRSGGNNRVNGVVAKNFIVEMQDTNAHGIQLAYIDNLVSGGHNVGPKEVSYISSIYTLDCTNVTHESNNLGGNYGAGAMMFATVSVNNDNIQIERQNVTGFGPKFKFYTNPTNLRFNYMRDVIVTSNGAGQITQATYDGEDFVTGAASDPNGFTITFKDHIDVGVANFSVLPAGSQIAGVYDRSVANKTVTFGIQGIAAGALSPLPAATNSYAVKISLSH